MNRHKLAIERQINERLYQFIMPAESHPDECVMILDDIRVALISLKEEIEKRVAEAKDKEPSKE